MSNARVNQPIVTHLIKQNCFTRDVTVHSSVPVRSPVYFTSLDEVSTPNGVEIKITENEYPITPQYVNSFVDSADYRRDPLGAIANAPQRRNLGDVREIQNVSQMDTSELLNLYNQLKTRFGEAKNAASQSSATPSASNPSGGDN